MHICRVCVQQCLHVLSLEFLFITKSLGGVDSLYSIVQMPSVYSRLQPLRSMELLMQQILAAKMLATTDTELRRKLVDYKEDLKEQVVAKDEKLNKIGYDAYLEQM